MCTKAPIRSVPIRFVLLWHLAVKDDSAANIIACERSNQFQVPAQGNIISVSRLLQLVFTIHHVKDGLVKVFWSSIIDVQYEPVYERLSR